MIILLAKDSFCLFDLCSFDIEIPASRYQSIEASLVKGGSSRNREADSL